MKDIDNLGEEMEYIKDVNNGCFKDDVGKSDFTEAGLIDEMEYIKDFNNGCFNEDTGELYEEAVYEKAVYEEAVVMLVCKLRHRLLSFCKYDEQSR